MSPPRDRLAEKKKKERKKSQKQQWSNGYGSSEAENGSTLSRERHKRAAQEERESEHLSAHTAVVFTSTHPLALACSHTCSVSLSPLLPLSLAHRQSCGGAVCRRAPSSGCLWSSFRNRSLSISFTAVSGKILAINLCSHMVPSAELNTDDQHRSSKAGGWCEVPLPGPGRQSSPVLPPLVMGHHPTVAP